MQKFITFTLIFSVFGASVFAGPTCDDLRKDLLALEYKIQMSKLDGCEDSSTPQNCMSESNNNFTTKYYSEIENDYNKALAELILAQGLNAIGSTIRGSYNSMAALNETNIDDASAYAQVLEQNLSKAELLEMAMIPVTQSQSAGGVDSTNDVSFLYKYNDRIRADMTQEDFNTTIQDICQSSVDADGELCRYIKNQVLSLPAQTSDEYGESQQLYLETLYGFFMADYRSRNQQAEDPQRDYDQYRNYLQISENADGTPMSAAAFRELNFGVVAGQERPMTRMTNALIRYRENPSATLAEKVFKAARDLDPIDVTYSNINSAGDDADMDSFMAREFQRPLDNLKVDPTDRVVSEIWKNNLDNMISEYENKVKVFDKGRDVLTTMGIEEHVAENQGGLNADNLQRTYSQVLGKLNNARECYNKPTLLEKQECLDSVKECLPAQAQSGLNFCGSLAEKRQAVEQAKNRMDFYNNGQPFLRLKTLKGLTLNSLERKNCHLGGEAVEQRNFACNRDLQIEPSQQFLNLGDELDNIQIRVDEDWVTQEMMEGDDNALLTFRTDRDDFMARECAGNRTDESVTRRYIENTCQFFEAKKSERDNYTRELREQEENRVAAQRRARAMRMSRSYTLGESRRSGFAIGATSAATTLVGHIPTLTATYLQGRQVKDTREQVYSYIAAREQQRVDQMEALQACQANPTTACGAFRYQQYNAYQFQLAQTGFNGMTNFQAGMGGSQFNNPGNPYSFSFSTNTNPSLNLTNDNTSAFGSFGNTSTTDSTTGPANGATPFSF